MLQRFSRTTRNSKLLFLWLYRCQNARGSFWWMVINFTHICLWIHPSVFWELQFLASTATHYKYSSGRWKQVYMSACLWYQSCLDGCWIIDSCTWKKGMSSNCSEWCNHSGLTTTCWTCYKLLNFSFLSKLPAFYS